MSEKVLEVERVPATTRILIASCVGAASGLVGTALALGSLPAGILGAIGGAIVSNIAALMSVETAEV